MNLRRFTIPFCLAFYFLLSTVYGSRDGSFAGPILVTLFQVVYIATSGTLIGLALAVLMTYRRYLPLDNSTIFFRQLIWLPFFVYWAVPIPVFVITLIGVTAYASYRFISLRIGLAWNWIKALKDVGKQSVFHALLYVLMFEVWSIRGWMASSTHNIEKTITVIALVLTFVYLVNLSFRTAFFSDASLERELILRDTNGAINSPRIGLILATIVLFLILASSDDSFRKLNLSSLYSVLSATRFIITSREGLLDLGVSIFEIVGGVTVAGALASVTTKSMERNTIKEFLSPILPLTFVVPLLSRHLEIAAIGWNSSPWSTAIGVALVSFYPFILAISGFHGFTNKCRLIVGVYSALPYAFVMMLYSETLAASKGIGFHVVVMRNTLQLEQALAGSLIIFLVFVGVSSFLVIAAQRFCKSG